MAKNYYQILGLNRGCIDTEIIVAYRKLAIQYHPRNEKTKDLKKFHEIAEAYEVLSNANYHSWYDKYGEAGLKEGVTLEHDNFIGGYKYQGNAFEIFEKFFGSSNPFFAGFSDDVSLRSFGISFPPGRKMTEEFPMDLVIEVQCTLEELYNGCQKTLTYTRSLLNADGASYRTEQFEKTIEIPPGAGSETSLTFPHEGNQYKSHATTNLVFKITEQPHSVFLRSGNDLIYTTRINLIDALAALPMQIVNFI